MPCLSLEETIGVDSESYEVAPAAHEDMDDDCSAVLSPAQKPVAELKAYYEQLMAV